MSVNDWICIHLKPHTHKLTLAYYSLNTTESSVVTGKQSGCNGVAGGLDSLAPTAAGSRAKLREEAASGESAWIHGNGVTHILSVQDAKKNVLGQKKMGG